MGGAFAKPRPKAPISQAGSDDVADRARFARLAEDRRAVDERSNQNRSKSVRMAREYRYKAGVQVYRVQVQSESLGASTGTKRPANIAIERDRLT